MPSSRDGWPQLKAADPDARKQYMFCLGPDRSPLPANCKLAPAAARP